ncbi:MAG: hypothetical protein Q7J57_08240, partial [Gemmobacter sp.]|nr:hypothetical protein [Gemmobacter sp.]
LKDTVARRYDISVLGSQQALKEKLGEAYWQASEPEDDPATPRAAFVSEEAISELEGGISVDFFFLGSYVALAAMLAVACTLAASTPIAIGGVPTVVLGVLLARRVGKHHKDYHATQIEYGGILLWVRVADKVREDLAGKSMKAHAGRDVHAHSRSE